MNDLTLRWTDGRFALHIGSQTHIEHARIGVCSENGWLFPFEKGATVSQWERWEDGIGLAMHQTVTARRTPDGLDTRFHIVRYESQPLVRVWLTLDNCCDKPVSLYGVHLLDIAAEDGACFDLGNVENSVIFTDSGSPHWAGVTKLLEQSGDYEEKWKHLCPPATLRRMLEVTDRREPGAGDHSSGSGLAVFTSDAPSAGAMMLGYAPVQRALSTIICRAAKDRGVEFLAAASGLYGYDLAPGASYTSEDLLIGWFPDGLKALSAYAEASAAIRNISVENKDLPSGWISWYAYRLEVTEDKILQNARIIADRFLPYGMDVIQPDYGWQKDYVANEWRETNTNFPHGMQWLAQQISTMGLRMGFWICPVELSGRSHLFTEHPEYCVKNENAEPLKLGNWTWGNREPMYVIDPTVPGAMDDFVDQMAYLRRTTGAKYWKADFLLPLLRIVGASFSDPSVVPGIEIYRLAAKALRRAAGDDYLYFCSNYSYAEWGLGDTTMTCPDIGNPCFSSSRYDDDRVYKLAHFRQGASTVLARHFLHRRLTLLNSDAANLGPEGSQAEARLRFSLAAFSGGQFFLGDDLTRYGEDRLALVEKALPSYGQAATPVDLFTSTFPDSPHIWHLPVTASWDHWDVLCLANMDDDNNVEVDLLSALDLQGDDLIFDFWEEKLLGPLADHSRFTLQPTESKILCVRRPKQQPHLLATNMHFTQGAVEVLNHHWDDVAKTLVLKLQRRPGADGKLWVTVPAGFTANAADHRLDGAKANIVPVSDRLTMANVEFLKAQASVVLSFTRN